MSNDLVEYLLNYVSPERRERMRRVLSRRTRWIIPVLEDIYQSQNASAVLRHCDAFGVQELHIIEARNAFRTDNGVALGSAQWLDLRRWKDAGEALDALKKRGCRIVATSPAGETAPEDLNLEDGPLALVFGNELEGVSGRVKAMADILLGIPMVGFVKSLNISASAAVVLYELTGRLRSLDIPWSLTERDRRETLLRWLRRTVPHAQDLEDRFRKTGIIIPSP